MPRTGCGRWRACAGSAPAACPRSSARSRSKPTGSCARWALPGWRTPSTRPPRRPSARCFDAYARGVNRWRETHDGALPPEFIATGLAPEPWRPADSLLWLRTMSLRLAENRNEELLRERLGRDSGPRAARRSVAAGAAWRSADHSRRGRRDANRAGPLTTEPGGGGAELERRVEHLGGRRLADEKRQAPARQRSAPQPRRADLVVSGARRNAGRDLAGATAPGFPFFIFGHNDRIAWGLTSTGSDVEDLFVERADPDDPGRYLTPSGSEPFAVRERDRSRSRAATMSRSPFARPVTAR